MINGFAFAMIDTFKMSGHMVELYQPLPQLTRFYDMIAQAAKTFNGGDIIETISFD